jgi:hypothetical protein
MNRLFRSLQSQLVLRLAAVFFVASLLGMGALVYEGNQAASTLGDDELERRAVQIAHFVVREPDGTLNLKLPLKLDRLYHSPVGARLLAVRSNDGALVAASGPEFAAEVKRWPISRSDRSPFRLDEFGPTSLQWTRGSRR